MKKILTSLLLVSAVTTGWSQDTPRPMLENPEATVHQFGIVRSGNYQKALSEKNLLDVPGFIHKSQPADAETTAVTWLDFSALYFTLPQMTSGSIAFDVTQQLGHVISWYPYASVPSEDNRRECKWTNVIAGMPADGLEDIPRDWMTARAMEAAATLKVYKPGPAGSKPDDVGTTEGDVFIFMRGTAEATDPVRAQFDPTSKTWTFNEGSIWSDVQYPLTTSTQHAWLAQFGLGAEIISRTVALHPGTGSMELLKTSATVQLEPYAREESVLQTQFNEALVGNGLRPDEAFAMSDLLLQSIRKSNGPVLIYFLPQRWTHARFPLKIDGPAKKPVRVFGVVLELPTSVEKRQTQ